MKKMLSLVLALALALTVCAVSLADTEGADLTGKKVGFSALMMSSEFFTDMSNQMHAPLHLLFITSSGPSEGLVFPRGEMYRKNPGLF